LFIEILLSIELRLWHLAGAALAAHFGVRRSSASLPGKIPDDAQHVSSFIFYAGLKGRSDCYHDAP